MNKRLEALKDNPETMRATQLVRDAADAAIVRHAAEYGLDPNRRRNLPKGSNWLPVIQSPAGVVDDSVDSSFIEISKFELEKRSLLDVIFKLPLSADLTIRFQTRPVNADFIVVQFYEVFPNGEVTFSAHNQLLEGNFIVASQTYAKDRLCSPEQIEKLAARIDAVEFEPKAH